MLAELREVKYRDLDDMVFEEELTYDGIVDIVDGNYIAGSAIEFTSPPSIYDNSDNNLMLRSLLPDDVKVNVTIDDIRL